MRFQLTTAVWGDWYVDQFLKANVPSLMSPRNIPALLERGVGRYTIYTRSKDATVIRHDRAFKRASELIPFEFKVYPDRYFLGNPHVVHAALWETAVQEARKAGEWIAFVSADNLWADGSFDSLARHFENGKSICYGFPLRVVDETAIPEVTQRFGYGRQDVISVPPRELVDVGLRHLSPMWGAYIRDTRHFANHHPEYLLEPVPNEGLVFRAMIPHCFAADPQRITLGGRLSSMEACDVTRMAFMTDSDDFAFLSFTSPTHQIDWYFCHARSDLLKTSRTWRHYYTADVAHLWRQKFLFHRGERHLPSWRQAVQRTSARLVQQFINFLTVAVATAAEEKGLLTAARLLATAAITARLHRYLRFREPVTLFIPNDFALGAARVSGLLADSSKLVEFILAHVGLTAWSSENGAPTESAAADGRRLTLRGGADPTVNGLRVVRKIDSPILEDLGVPVYEIDGVLNPEGAQ